MMRTRLESMSPTLGEAFRQAKAAKKRKAVLTASAIAASQNGLRGKIIDDALGLLRQGGGGNKLRPELESLCREYDDAYFRLQQEIGSEQEMLLQFRKARAAAALAFALSPDAEHVHEALYESIMSADDSEEMVRVLTETLS